MRLIKKFQLGSKFLALIELFRKPKSVYSYAYSEADRLPIYSKETTLPEATVTAKRVVKRLPKDTVLPEAVVTGYSKKTKDKLKLLITNDYLKSIGAFPTKESFAVKPEYENDNQVNVDELRGIPYNELQALPTMQAVMDYMRAKKRLERKRQFTGETPNDLPIETTNERPTFNAEDLKSGIDLQYIPKSKNQKLIVKGLLPLSFLKDNLSAQLQVRGMRPDIYSIQLRLQVPNEYLENALMPLGYAKLRREALAFAFNPNLYTDYYPMSEVVITAKRK